MRKLTIEKAQRLAILHRGRCLSRKYERNSAALKWQCSNPTHKAFRASYSQVCAGRWCPECNRLDSSRAQKLNKSVRAACKKKNILILDGNIRIRRSRIKLQCEVCRHKWASDAGQLLKFHGCRMCAAKMNGLNKRFSLKKVRQDIKTKGYKLLSETYEGAGKPLLLHCPLEQHGPFKARYITIMKGQGCPKCGNIKKGKSQRRYNVKDINRFAKNLGFVCEFNQDESITVTQKLPFRCLQCGEHFKRTFDDVKQKQGGCPECSLPHFREHRIRQIFKYLLSADFPNMYPDWLKPAKGNRLQLDGYNESLGIAFEHNGEQHYKYFKLYHGNGRSLQTIQASDRIKNRLCKRHGVKLFVISYSIPTENLPEHIHRLLLQRGVKSKRTWRTFKPNAENLSSQAHLAWMRAYAKKRNGKCYANVWLGTQMKYPFECKRGHRFECHYQNMRRLKTWCRQCYFESRKKFTLDDLQNLAAMVGGKGSKCLATKYVSSGEKIPWKCPNRRHPIFFISANHVRHSRVFCKLCKAERRILKNLRYEIR